MRALIVEAVSTDRRPEEGPAQGGEEWRGGGGSGGLGRYIKLFSPE